MAITVFFHILTYGTARQDAFCDVEDIKSGEKLNGCKYLRACLDESMMMSPPVPGMLHRMVRPGGI